jgi:hypothetical protein
MSLVERLRATDPFVNDPVSLQPRLRNPDGPEAADTIEQLTAALEEIANPIAAMQRRAAQEGHALNGPAAIALSDDPAHLKSIARAALSKASETQP